MSTEPTRSRPTVVDRRLGTDRRDALPDTNLERRRGPGRRRSDFRRDADEGTFDTEQMYFLKAIEMWRREANCSMRGAKLEPSPARIRSIGYRRTAGHHPIDQLGSSSCGVSRGLFGGFAARTGPIPKLDGNVPRCDRCSSAPVDRCARSHPTDGIPQSSALRI